MLICFIADFIPDDSNGNSAGFSVTGNHGIKCSELCRDRHEFVIQIHRRKWISGIKRNGCKPWKPIVRRLASLLSLKLGKDIGIISYNDIPIKEIVANGITTISTDFAKMGADVIHLILKKKKLQLKNPCRLVERASF